MRQSRPGSEPLPSGDGADLRAALPLVDVHLTRLIARHATSESVESKRCSSAAPRRRPARTRPIEGAGAGSVCSRSHSLSALDSEAKRGSDGPSNVAVGLTGPTTGKSFVLRGVDTERKAGLTRFLLIRLTPQTPRDSVGRDAPGVSSVVARV